MEEFGTGDRVTSFHRLVLTKIKQLLTPFPMKQSAAFSSAILGPSLQIIL